MPQSRKKTFTLSTLHVNALVAEMKKWKIFSLTNENHMIVEPLGGYGRNFIIVSEVGRHVVICLTLLGRKKLQKNALTRV